MVIPKKYLKNCPHVLYYVLLDGKSNYFMCRFYTIFDSIKSTILLQYYREYVGSEP